MDSRARNLVSFLAGSLLSYVTFISPLYANPQNGTVVAGDASISQTDAKTLTIQQNSDKAIINWQSFNIAADEHTHFQQPGSSSIMLNRVVGGGISQIFGQLSANGKVVLVNPAGIYFGPTARINVASLIATTADIKNEDFLAGNYKFMQAPDKATSVINEGEIHAAEGLVALVAPAVANSGVIEANLGRVVLASGNEFTIDLYGDQIINFAVNNKVTQTPVDQNNMPVQDAVANRGSLIADGGKIVMTANVAQNVVQNVINMQGVAQARSVVQRNGEIILSGGETGIVKVSGRLDVSGKIAGRKGGTVKIVGQHIKLENAQIDASGDQGGGTVLIGGNYQGQGPEMNATTTWVDADSVIDASAITQGDGGTIIIRSNEKTIMNGSAFAKGGIQTGNGGMIETSGNEVDLTGASINASASHGKAGTWLVDPTFISICHLNPPVCANTSSLITDATINSSLNNGTDFILNADFISVSTGAAITLNNASYSPTLTLNATSTLNMSAGSHLSASAGQLNVNLYAGNAMVLNGDISLNGGSLALSAGGASSITGNGSINVVSFNLISGTWDQNNAVLPVFNATNDFQIQSGAVFQRFAGGTGLVADPYIIQDIYGLQGIASSTTLLSKAYQLGNDIDASVTANWNGGAGFNPVGTSSAPFTGTLEGANYAINDLTIANANAAGLFAYTSQATIQNIGLTNINIMGAAGATTGGFVAYAQDYTTFDNVYLTGSIYSADNTTGGIAGFLYGNSTISNSYNAADVIGVNGQVGGLVGHVLQNASISNSYNTGAISGGHNVGGLAGQNDGLITQSYNTGNVISTPDINNNGNKVGGIAAVNYGTITNSYNTGSVTGTSIVGGLVGETETSSVITNSYNNGAVTGADSVGGITGYVASSSTDVSNNYNSGYVTGGNVYTGGLVGAIDNGSLANYATIFSHNYWDQDTSGSTSGVGGGLTLSGITAEHTSQMMTQSTFSGWNFTSPWGIINGASYPYLSAFYSATPQVISGTVYSDQGTTISAGQTVAIANNGSSLASAISGANGFYYYLAPANTFTAGNFLLAYIPSASGSAVSSTSVAGVSSADATNGYLKGFDLDGNRVTAYFPGNALSNTGLSIAKGSLSDSGILYTVSGQNITITGNNNFSTPIGTTYNIDGDLTVSNGYANFQDAVTISDGSHVNTSGDQTYNGVVTLNSNAVLTSQNGNISFADTINGNNHDLTLEATNGNISLAQVGASGAALSALNITQANSLDVNGAIYANMLAGNINTININSTDVNINAVVNNLAAAGGTINLMAGNYAQDVALTRSVNLATSGTINLNSFSNSAAVGISGQYSANGFDFNAPVTLLGDTVFNANNSSININNTITGPYALTLTSLGSINVNSSLGDSINRLGSLTMNGAAQLNAANYYTSGDQNYNGAVTLGGNVMLDTSNGSITFNNTITGAHDLTLSAPNGNITFVGAAGSKANRLGAVTILNASNVTEYSALKVSSFTQYAGSGVTDFGNIDVDAAQNVYVSTAQILGSIFAGGNVTLYASNNISNAFIQAVNAILIGMNGVYNTNVNVGSLTVGGLNGGTLFGVVNGFGGTQAVYQNPARVFLASHSNGLFTLNDVPIGLVNTNVDLYHITSSSGDGNNGNYNLGTKSQEEVAANTKIEIDGTAAYLLAARSICA